MSDFSIFVSSYSELKNSELKKFVNDVADALKMEAYQAAYNNAQAKPIKFAKIKVGGKKKVEYASVAEVFGDYLKAKEPSQIKALTQDFGPKTLFRGSSVNLSMLKRIDIKNRKSSLDQVNIKESFNYINDNFIFNKVGPLLNVFPSNQEAPRQGGSSGPTHNPTLKLNLSQVRCIDETDPEWGGKDKISVGGVTVDDKNAQSIIREFVAGNFNDGDVVNYRPDKVLKEFLLDNINPSTFTAFITIAEKDNGGFSDFLNKLYDAIKANLAKIFAALGAAAGAAIGTAIGGSIGTAIAGPLGAIIGIVAGLILGALVGWIVSVLQDDVFEPVITSVTLNSNTPFRGPNQTLSYRDFGGQYALRVFWSAS